MSRRNSSAREMNATAGPASGTRDAAVCRCCASSDDAVTYDVFTGTCTNGQTYCDVLMECAPIQVSKDERLPASVCYACVSFLERFVAFRAKCFETDAILRAEPTIKREAADGGGATRTLEANPDGPCESVEIKDEPVDDAEAYSEAYDRSWSPAAKAEPVDDDTGSPCEGAGVREQDPGGMRRRHECDRCGKSFVQKKYLKVHLTVHTGEKPFKCAECGKSFRAKQNLLWHGYVHSGEARPHECDLCERSFLQRTQLDTHRNVHTGEKPFACGLCDATFRSKRQLGSHGRVHEKAAGRTPAKRTARVRAPGEKAERRAVRYECKACDKLYVRKEHLDLHLKIHADDRPFACGECGRSFALKRQLALHGHVHARKKSNGERERLDDSHGTKNGIDARKTFGCDVCGKKYVRESRLDFHRRTHAGERHRCSHTGEKKPYERDVCTKGFFCDSKLAEHVTDGDGKPFECDSCGRSYPQSVSLDVHEKIDERLGNVASHRRPSGNADEGRTYECDSCDRKYRTKNGLEYHLKTHADERSFERDLRDERFVSPSHSGVHAGGRPHACDSCDRTFLYRGSLDAHRRTHAAFKTKHGGNRESKFEACAKPDREDCEVSDERVAIPPDTVGEEAFSTDVERDSAE